ncbi:MAG: LCP family protein [Nocardioidaceae bacterium]
MADRPRDPDNGGYGWLYRPQEEDDEATRRIASSRRDPAGDPGRSDYAGHGGYAGQSDYAGSHGDDPEPTRRMPVGGRPPGGERMRSRPAAPPPPPPPPPPTRAAPRSRRARPRPRWGRIIILALLAWLVFLIVVPIWAISNIEKVDAEPGGQRPESTPGATYLLVGSDSREGLTRRERRELATGNVGGQRTDTILLLHEPLFGGETLLVSLPRDSIVDIPGVGSGQKLNSAFAFGGPRLLVRTVESETGLKIDNYVEIGLGGFVNTVDAVGGVEICPKTKMKDKLAGLDIEKGCQEADGATALGYVRSRHVSATGDIDRGRRQREVLGQVASKAASPWTFINPFRYFALNKAGSDSLRIGDNVGPIDLARFAWAMRKVSGGNGKTCTVPIVDLAVNWDDERANEMFDLIREDSTDEIGHRLCTKTGLPR